MTDVSPRTMPLMITCLPKKYASHDDLYQTKKHVSHDDLCQPKKYTSHDDLYQTKKHVSHDDLYQPKKYASHDDLYQPRSMPLMMTYISQEVCLSWWPISAQEVCLSWYAYIYMSNLRRMYNLAGTWWAMIMHQHVIIYISKLKRNRLAINFFITYTSKNASNDICGISCSW